MTVPAEEVGLGGGGAQGLGAGEVGVAKDCSLELPLLNVTMLVMMVKVARGRSELLEIRRQLRVMVMVVVMRLLVLRLLVMVVVMVVIGVVEVRGGDLLEMLPQVAVVAVGDVDEGFSAGVVGSRGGDDLWAGLEGGGRVVELHVHAAGVAVGHLAGEEAKRVQRVTSYVFVMSFSFLVFLVVRGRNPLFENRFVLLPVAEFPVLTTELISVFFGCSQDSRGRPNLGHFYLVFHPAFV